jgi:hypothetical protein
MGNIFQSHAKCSRPESKETLQENRRNRAPWAILKVMALWGESDVISADERKEKNELEGPRSEYIKGYRDWKSYRITCIHSTDQMRLHVPYKMPNLAMLQSHLSTNLSGIP